MALRTRFALAGIVLLLAWLSTPTSRAADPPARAVAAKGAIAPAAPVLPAEVVAALQEGHFADAQAALAKLADGAKDRSEKTYYAYIRGIALRLDGKKDDARETLSAALEADPKGTWAAKLRFELAAVELTAGRFAAAEQLARAEAETLLAGDRKDRLAEVYHAFARRLLKPDDPIVPADPNGAYELLTQARGLAKSAALRAQLLFAMGRASQAANNHGRALQDFQNYLNEYPKGADRTAARYHLGEAQWHAGQRLQARLTWTDLARDLGNAKAPLAKGDDEFRAKALYQVAHTFGIPSPPDDTNLNLGVAALRRYLEAYPAHPWAVRAAYEIGAAYLARGKSQQALEAFTAFLKEEGFRAETDDAKRDLAQLAMTATFQVGQVLQGQQKFAEAIAAWKGYLAKYPNGPQSADAQRAILDTQLLIAADHLQREHYAEARTAWQTFVAQNPLDGRVPQILFQVGDSFVAEKKHEQAIAAWEPLLSKFPQSEPAAHAQFAIASIYENEKGDPATAIERFKKIAIEPWKAQAAQRVAVMESKALTVVTPRSFRSGEKAHLKITTRNLEKLTFTAYKLNAEAYFRKKQMLTSVESLDISLVQPDAEWTAEVPGYAKYKPVEQEYTLKLDVPGVFVVKVTDEKTLQATTLVLGSDLDAIVKVSREQLLVFAQDMKTGQGRAGARVLVADNASGQVVLEAKTGKDGVLLQKWEKPRDPNQALHYLVLDGPDVAGSGLGVPEKVAQGITPRAYIYTDRPAYRPGQQVALRGIVREVQDGQYANVPKTVYRLEVTDARGRQIVARPVTLSEFGTFHETLPLDSGAPAGTYRVRVYQPSKSEFAGSFEVQSYQLEKIDLAFDLKKTVFFRGETVAADLVAKYQYGAPVANRPVAVRLPDGRVLHGTTSAEGKYHVEFPTEGFAEEQALRLLAQLPQDNVGTAATVMLAIRAFNISLKTTRDVYLDGESFQLIATTHDAQGEPTGETLNVSVLKQVNQAGRATEREVVRKPLKTDPKTGRGSLSLQVDDEQGGSFVVRVAGTDRFGNPVVADRALTISGKKDETKLRLLADRQTYKVGEEASVNLHSRGVGGTALLSWEADRILSYKIVRLVEGDNALAWAINGEQFPNFTLTAARMTGTRFDEATL
ncbi:MAG: MG2 domain-containing protein, partial [Isosphaeraceae bacterium]|nr:MG2 domain-containing protein [Isosphaeraceae bacterium]